MLDFFEGWIQASSLRRRASHEYVSSCNRSFSLKTRTSSLHENVLHFDRKTTATDTKETEE